MEATIEGLGFRVLYLGYIGIMEKNMETRGMLGIIQGLYGFPLPLLFVLITLEMP